MKEEGETGQFYYPVTNNAEAVLNLAKLNG